MSAELDVQMRDQEHPEAPDVESQNSASEGSDDEEPEAAANLMVVSRSRRSNAGNRMSTLLAQTAEEEQWGEDWEDAPNEEEFLGDDADNQDDYNLDSSSSEEEEEVADGEDAGEKELRKAERQERIKKRKTGANPFAAKLAAAARKRVKLDVPPNTSDNAPAPRPKKKSERASWIPTLEDGPSRMSSRQATVANKEETLARLKKKDKKREDTLAMMKAAEERKEKDKPKVMTQQERLAEAARVEKQNSKSLHRWEEAEERRAVERQAKLDALKNRQLEGPFIRYYSGPAIYVDANVKYYGKDIPKIEEVEKKVNSKVDALEAQRPQSGARLPSEHTPNQGEATQQPLYPSQTQNFQVVSTTPAPQASERDHPKDAASTKYPSTIMFTPPTTSDSFLYGIEHYAAMQIEPSLNINPYPLSTPKPPISGSPSQQSPPQPEKRLSDPDRPPQASPHPPLQTQQSQIQTPYYSQYTSQSPHGQPPYQSQPQSQLPTHLQHLHSAQPSDPPPPPRRKAITLSNRQVLILTSFPNLDTLPAAPTTTTTAALREKYRPTQVALSQILFRWNQADATLFASIHTTSKYNTKNSSIPIPARERCAVTGKLARYRDPKTGLGYRDRAALGMIRRMCGGGVGWSSLGVLVPMGRERDRRVAPAKGVPVRFRDPRAVVEKTAEKPTEKPVEGGTAAMANKPASIATATPSTPAQNAEAGAGAPSGGEVHMKKEESVTGSTTV